MASDRRSPEWDLHAGPSNYVWLLSAHACGALLSLFAAWWATQYLGADGYGLIVAVIALSQTASQLVLHWSSTAVVRFGTEEFVRTGRLAETFWARTWILVVSFGVALLASPVWLPALTGWFRLPTGLAGLVLAHLGATAVWNHTQLTLQAAKLPRRQAAQQLLERIVVVVGLLLAGSFAPSSAGVWIWAYVLSPLASASATLVFLARYVGPPRLVHATALRQILRFSLPLVPYAAIGYFSSYQLDSFFLLRSHSHGDLASYAISYQAAGVLMQLPALAGSLQLPFLITLETDGRRANVQRLFGEVLPLACLVWSVLCASVASVASVLLPVIFGPSLAETGTLMWPLLAAAAIAGPVMAGHGPLVNARNATDSVLIAGILSSAANVYLNWWLVPTFGVHGCAWATVAAYGVTLLVVERRARRIIGTAAVPRLAWTTLPAITAAAAAAIGISAWASLGTGLLAALCVAGALRKAVGLGLAIIIKRPWAVWHLPSSGGAPALPVDQRCRSRIDHRDS